MKKIIPVFHSCLSHQKVIDFILTCISFKIDTIILTKVGGAAAQIGIPEAFKYAVKSNIKLLIFPDLQDLKNIFHNSTFYFIVDKKFSNEKLNVNEIKDLAVSGTTVFLVFSGMEPGFLKKELELGKAVHINLNNNIPPVALTAITLYLVKNVY